VKNKKTTKAAKKAPAKNSSSEAKKTPSGNNGRVAKEGHKARKGFLEIVKGTHGDGNYVGDQHGGAGGIDGSGLPSGFAGNFMFATGIECSYPTIKQGRLRRDQLKECGHYEHWKKDLRLVQELGLKVLRYGLPYYSIHRAPGKFDWSFADEVMNEIQRLNITPILDLLHFGVPSWVGDFQNPELPTHFADFADAVAARYPWVRFYTPVNEIYVTAKMSAKDGVWNEQLKDDKAFVTALMSPHSNTALPHPYSPHTELRSVAPTASSSNPSPPNICTKPALRPRRKLRSKINSVSYRSTCSTRINRTPTFIST